MVGQLLAMEAWELDFVPGRRAIQRTIVWMHLPGLLMEFWLSTAIMAIAAEVGKSQAVDDFTELLRKTGYARVRVEIDARIPLKPGVLIRGKGVCFGNSSCTRTYRLFATGVEG